MGLGRVVSKDRRVTDLFLTDAEIEALCVPLKQPAAQVRFLRASGLTVTVKPNGRPAVVRSHVEVVLSGGKPDAPSNQVEEMKVAAPRANVDGFLQMIKRGKNGPAKKIESA